MSPKSFQESTWFMLGILGIKKRQIVLIFGHILGSLEELLKICMSRLLPAN